MPGSTATNPPIRLVIRLLLEFMISAMPPLARWHGGALERGIVFLAIAQANRPRFSDLARQGLAPSTRSDTGLKPVSVLSIADSLGLAYESARRRVVGLARDGLVLRLGQGVIVPNAVIADAPFETFAHGTYAHFLSMLRGLRAIGFDFASLGKADLPADDLAASEEAPDLAVRHVVIDFVLRLVECGLVAHDNDMVRALIFSAIMAANARPYTADPDAAWAYATLDRSPPEDKRRPVTVAEVAALTGIPYETTRRYVLAMLRDRDIVRIHGKGLINPLESPRDALLHRSGALVMSRFVQLIGDLTRLGFSFDSFGLEAKDKVA